MTGQRMGWILYGLMSLAAVLLFVYGGINLNSASVIVEWSTASELDMVGFNLSRSETLTGPFKPVNAQLIPASSDPVAGGSYRYEDKPVQPGRTYYYMLESVNADGTSEQHGPVTVQAQGGGVLEIAAGAILLLGVVLGVISLVRVRRG